VFNGCPYEGGYDLKLGTNDNGRITDYEKIRKFAGFKHALVFFGGLGGIESIIEQEEESGAKLEEVAKLFDIY
jgi:hypothetical protein